MARPRKLTYRQQLVLELLHTGRPISTSIAGRWLRENRLKEGKTPFLKQARKVLGQLKRMGLAESQLQGGERVWRLTEG